MMSKYPTGFNVKFTKHENDDGAKSSILTITDIKNNVLSLYNNGTISAYGPMRTMADVESFVCSVHTLILPYVYKISSLNV